MTMNSSWIDRIKPKS